MAADQPSAGRPHIQRRPLPEPLPRLCADPLLNRLYAARGVQQAGALELRLSRLLPAQDLKGLDAALDRLAQALDRQEHILIVGDFDADGATSTTLMVLALRDLGAQVSYLVPDRFKYGYGLTPAIVDLALSTAYAAGPPRLLVTVDNGISGHEGVAHAHACGLEVIITDHHLSTHAPPPACAVVNPNQPGCAFASKALAGVGVAFYVLAALSTRRRQQGQPGSRLTDYLDLVALGTVADVAPLDANNRILVAQGLQRIRLGQCRPGILALLQVAGRTASGLEASDLGFVLGPRINAAGRMEHMRTGIECLLAPTLEQALPLAERLDALNRERRSTEARMQRDAQALLAARPLLEQAQPSGAIVLYEPGWHQGVIGIVAGRLKEQYHRPAVVFAAADGRAELIKGSARSIPGVHIRDAIEAVAERHPGLVHYFGGHAAAAGLTLAAADLPLFTDALNTEMARYPAEVFAEVLYSDGALTAAELHANTARTLAQAGPWGQAFAPPLFEGEFHLLEFRWLSDGKHLKLSLRPLDGAETLEAIWFNATPLGLQQVLRVGLLYRLGLNTFRQQTRLQLEVVQGWVL